MYLWFLAILQQPCVQCRCYDRTGCLAGSIIGAVIFALIALGLLVCLLLRLKRQRAAQQAYYNQQVQLASLAVLRQSTVSHAAALSNLTMMCMRDVIKLCIMCEQGCGCWYGYNVCATLTICLCSSIAEPASLRHQQRATIPGVHRPAGPALPPALPPAWLRPAGRRWRPAAQQHD